MSRWVRTIRCRSGCLAWSCWIVSLCAMSGCLGEDRSARSGPAKPSFAGVKLTVRALHDSAILTGLRAERGEWQASRGAELTINDEPIRSLENLSDLDLLIFPGQELGGLVDADLLELIPNSLVVPARQEDDGTAKSERTESAEESPAEAFHYSDLAPAFRDEVTKYGSDRLALPLGSSALVLVYRRDAFSRQANIDAARQAGITLKPPSTWGQLDALARFFEGKDWSGDGRPDHGIAAVLGHDAEGIGNVTYLARAIGLAQHRDQYSFLFDSGSMTPRIDVPPFVEALRDVIAWKRLGPPGMDKLDGPAARQAFRVGQVALLIDRAERAGLVGRASRRSRAVARIRSRVRALAPAMGDVFITQYPQLLAAGWRLAHWNQARIDRASARGCARLRPLYGQSRECQSPSRGVRFSHAAGTQLTDGTGPARPDLRARRRFPAVDGRRQPYADGRPGRTRPPNTRGRRVPRGPGPRASRRARWQGSGNGPT